MRHTAKKGQTQTLNDQYVRFSGVNPVCVFFKSRVASTSLPAARMPIETARSSPSKCQAQCAPHRPVRKVCMSSNHSSNDDHLKQGGSAIPIILRVALMRCESKI